MFKNQLFAQFLVYYLSYSIMRVFVFLVSLFVAYTYYMSGCLNLHRLFSWMVYDLAFMWWILIALFCTATKKVQSFSLGILCITLSIPLHYKISFIDLLKWTCNCFTPFGFLGFIIFTEIFVSVYSFQNFHICSNWWSFTGVWVTASLLRLPRLFSVS